MSPADDGDAPTRRMPPLKAPDLLRTLHRHGVEFVVIGGFSLAAHSVARATKDLDVVPAPGRANLRRLLAALEDLEASPSALDDFDPNEILELSLENLELGGNWILRTRYGRLDVMQYVEGVRDYGRLRENAVQPQIEAIEEPTLFAGLDDLIAMKTAAGRDQDLIDIDMLERSRQSPV
jgi:hypothetical protein